MVSFCNEVVNEIKAASDETALVGVIRSSMSRFRNERNSFNDDGYIMNMIVSLRSSERETLSSRSIDNIRIAIAIFKKFQHDNPSRIF
jgi:hypothetical protein